MRRSVFVTADIPARPSGGGVVTLNEYLALLRLGQVKFINGNVLKRGPSPFDTDLDAAKSIEGKFDLAHFYAGTFPVTAKTAKDNGARLTYTCAAHDREISRQEHEIMGVKYDYPDTATDEAFAKHLGGYLAADILICPSRHSESCMRRYGAKRVEIIPHGTDVFGAPPLPKRFSVGFLGSSGVDKGLIYLLKAWDALNSRTSVLKVTTPHWQSYLPMKGKGDVVFSGFIQDTLDFYSSISVYVQPSVTEGFGIEVLEALALGRPVIATSNTGACDLIKDGHNGFVVPIRAPSDIASRIDMLASSPAMLEEMSRNARASSTQFSWAAIREKYLRTWKDLLEESR